MIAVPVNDEDCLGAISEDIAQRVERGDETLVEIANQYPTTAALQGWIRGLPQRDDLGTRADGPKIGACSPAQRLRIGPEDPNCVERAALYIGAAELIDPVPVRRLLTVDTPEGRHTLPLEDGKAVILNPNMPRNCIDCAMALLEDGPVAIDPRAAVEWTTHLAESAATSMRNGPSRVRIARNAIYRLVEHGIAPRTREEIDVMGWLLSLAERVARDYGPRALAIVRSTALALVRLVDDAIARTGGAPSGAVSGRNLSFKLGGYTIRPASWTMSLARIAGRVGTEVGGAIITKKLAALGVGADVLRALEHQLASEGLRVSVQPAKTAAPAQPAATSSTTDSSDA